MSGTKKGSRKKSKKGSANHQKPSINREQLSAQVSREQPLVDERKSVVEEPAPLNEPEPNVTASQSVKEPIDATPNEQSLHTNDSPRPTEQGSIATEQTDSVEDHSPSEEGGKKSEESAIPTNLADQKSTDKKESSEKKSGKKREKSEKKSKEVKDKKERATKNSSSRAKKRGWRATKREKGEGRIAVLIFSDLSEVAQSVWSVRAVARLWNIKEVGVVTQPTYAPLFNGERGVEVIDYLPKRGRGGVYYLWRLAGALLKADYRKVADLQNNRFSRTLRRMIRIRSLWNVEIAVSDKQHSLKRLMFRKFRKVLMKHTSIVERHIAVFSNLGIDSLRPIEPTVERPKIKERYKVPEALREEFGPGSWPSVGYSPFAGQQGKMFPTPQSDELVGALTQRFGRVVIFGEGELERQFAEGMVAKYGQKVVVAVDRVTLAEEIELMGVLDVMITPDTATLHLASLAGTPTLTIWGATHPFAGAAGYGQHPSWQISADLPCRPCSVDGNKSCIFGDYRCLTSLSVDEISRRAYDLYTLHRPTGGGDAPQDKER